MCRKTVSPNATPSPETMREIEELLAGLSPAIRERLDEAVPEGERSEKIAGVVGLLIRAGLSDGEIGSLIEVSAIANRFRDQPAGYERKSTACGKKDSVRPSRQRRWASTR
jgi:hypothetical protein